MTKKSYRETLKSVLGRSIFHLKACVNATDVVTCITVIGSVSSIVPTKTATCRIDYRNLHSQKWCHSEFILVKVKTRSE